MTGAKSKYTRHLVKEKQIIYKGISDKYLAMPPPPPKKNLLMKFKQ